MISYELLDNIQFEDLLVRPEACVGRRAARPGSR
jgi:hypothetical protein